MLDGAASDVDILLIGDLCTWRYANGFFRRACA
jgi:hypothetical protein